MKNQVEVCAEGEPGEEPGEEVRAEGEPGEEPGEEVRAEGEPGEEPGEGFVLKVSRMENQVKDFVPKVSRVKNGWRLRAEGQPRPEDQLAEAEPDPAPDAGHAEGGDGRAEGEENGADFINHKNVEIYSGIEGFFQRLLNEHQDLRNEEARNLSPEEHAKYVLEGLILLKNNKKKRGNCNKRFKHTVKN